tara:strand:- start:414 stop:1490 length:1077 start_codon:yes stop_codon:yes gene_type:complete
MATTFAVPDGRVAMAATLYTGTGAGSPQNISNAVNAVSFQPGLVWVKARNANGNNAVTDSVRGAYLQLITQLTNAEANYSPYGVTAFNANGFGVNDDNSGNYSVNGAAGGLYSGTPPNYVAWQWKAGGTAVSNTAGTITSSVSANTTAGFSVVTYTGTGANATVGHGLGVAPAMIIVKNRTSGVPSWRVYHSALPYTSYLYLDTTNAAFTGGGVWTQTPTTTLFGINGTDAGVGTANNYVAYCWAPVAGYSAFGSYTGNGSADGTFIYTGFRPRWLMIKEITVGGTPWMVWDSSRDTYNPEAARLVPNTSDAEVSVSIGDFVSNGIKIRQTGTSYNATGSTYIYACFAENPLRYSNAR